MKSNDLVLKAAGLAHMLKLAAESGTTKRAGEDAIRPAVEALVHISELGGGEGADPEKVFTLNERKEFVVLEIAKDNRKISLSLADKKKK